MTEETNNNETEMQVYELGYHILPSVAEDDLESEVAKIRTAIESRQGSFIAEGTTEHIDLAYPMVVNNGGKHTTYSTAYFGWIKFEMEPAEAVALQHEDLKPNASILRFILIKTTREETRARLQTEQHTILREVRTNTTLEKRAFTEESEEVSEEEIEKSIDEIVGDDTDEQEVEKESEAGTSTNDESDKDESTEETTEETTEEKSA